MPITKGGGGGSSVFSPITEPIQHGLIDPLAKAYAPIQPYVDTANVVKKSAQKVVKSGRKGVTKLDKARKKWDGKEKVYSINDQGFVQKDKRGVDTEHVNGFQKELARDNLKTGLKSMGKTVTKAGKGAAKSMTAFDTVMDVGKEVLDSVNPLTAASQIAAGTQKMITGGVDAVTYQSRKNRAREGQKAFKGDENGNNKSVLRYGFKNTKRSLSRSRNKAMGDTAIGGLEAAKGGLGIAQFVDPTGGTAIAHKVVSGVHKLAKWGATGFRAMREGLRYEKMQKMRKKADEGDAEAMRWMLKNDPRMGSAQMLMHARDNTDPNKQEEVQGHIAKSLGLGEDGKRELGTGRLSEFDKLYANRTGQNLESQLGLKNAAVYQYLRAPAKLMSKAWGGIKGAFSKKKPLSDEKKQEALAEYNKVKDFRIAETHKDMVDKAEQTSLKNRFKAGSDTNGELFNLDKLDEMDTRDQKVKTGQNPPQPGAGYKTANKYERRIDLLYAHQTKKFSKQSVDRTAEMLGPWAKTSHLPTDIRRDLAKYEEKRETEGRKAGRDLQTPTNQGGAGEWQQAQRKNELEQMKTRLGLMEKGELKGQLQEKSETKPEDLVKLQEKQEKKAKDYKKDIDSYEKEVGEGDKKLDKRKQSKDGGVKETASQQKDADSKDKKLRGDKRKHGNWESKFQERRKRGGGIFGALFNR